MRSQNVDKREKILALEEDALVIQQTLFRSYAVSYAISSRRNLVLEGKEYLRKRETKGLESVVRKLIVQKLPKS